MGLAWFIDTGFFPHGLEDTTASQLQLLVGHIVWFRFNGEDFVEESCPFHPFSPPGSEVAGEYRDENSTWRPALICEVEYPAGYHREYASVCLALLHHCTPGCERVSHSRTLHDAWMAPLSPTPAKRAAPGMSQSIIEPLMVDGEWNEAGWYVHLANLWDREPRWHHVRRSPGLSSSTSPRLPAHELQRLRSLLELRAHDRRTSTWQSDKVVLPYELRDTIRTEAAEALSCISAFVPPRRVFGTPAMTTLAVEFSFWKGLKESDDTRSLTSCLSADINKMRHLIEGLFHSVHSSQVPPDHNDWLDSESQQVFSDDSQRVAFHRPSSSENSVWMLIWLSHEPCFIEGMSFASWSSLSRVCKALVNCCQSHMFSCIPVSLDGELASQKSLSNRLDGLLELCTVRPELSLNINSLCVDLTSGLRPFAGTDGGDIMQKLFAVVKCITMTSPSLTVKWIDPLSECREAQDLLLPLLARASWRVERYFDFKQPYSRPLFPIWKRASDWVHGHNDQIFFELEGPNLRRAPAASFCFSDWESDSDSASGSTGSDDEEENQEEDDEEEEELLAEVEKNDSRDALSCK